MATDHIENCAMLLPDSDAKKESLFFNDILLTLPIDMDITHFNIRVYGLVLNKSGELLISHEKYKGQQLTKFIGGGLEKGEGLKSALEREFIEEMNQKIKVKSLFYINDFFQQSAFVKTDQIISVFYEVEPLNTKSFYNTSINETNGQVFEWLPLAEIQPDLFTFQIEREVLNLLKKRHLE